MYLIIKTVVNILLKSKETEFYKLVGLMLIISLLELIGLGVMLPVIGLFSEGLNNSDIIATIMEFTQVNDAKIAAYLVLFLLILFFLLKSAFSLLTVFRQQYFVNTVFRDTSVRILKTTLGLTYEEFSAQDKSLYLKNIVTSSNYLSYCTYSVLQLFSEILVLITVVIFLSLYVGIVPVLYFGILMIIFAILFKFITRNISKLGEQRDLVMHEITKSATEALNGYREIKIDQVACEVLSSYEKKITPYVSINSKHGVISSIPRVFLETITAMLIIGYIFVISLRDISAGLIIEELVIFAFIGIRIIPSLNKLLTASTSIKYFGTEVEYFSDIFKSNEEKPTDKKKISSFESHIELRDIYYSYPNVTTSTLKGVSFKLEKNKRYGFVGKSGSGKSTLFDIILGFISPSTGEMYIDGQLYNSFEEVDLNELMGLVSQSFFVLDASFKDNIIFHKTGEFNEKKFKESLQGSQLEQVISSDFDRMVGENGARLSGGQRQRLAIARSLYSSKEILLLDEATSALDNQTEQSFLNFLDRQSNQTLLIIAHRLSTVRKCDKIFVMSEGVIVAEGTYDDLISNSEIFRELVYGISND